MHQSGWRTVKVEGLKTDIGYISLGNSLQPIHHQKTLYQRTLHHDTCSFIKSVCFFSFTTTSFSPDRFPNEPICPDLHNVDELQRLYSLSWIERALRKLWRNGSTEACFTQHHMRMINSKTILLKIQRKSKLVTWRWKESSSVSRMRYFHIPLDDGKSESTLVVHNLELHKNAPVRQITRFAGKIS